MVEVFGFSMAHGCGVFGERTPEILRWLHKMNETKYSDRAQYYLENEYGK